LPGIYSRIRNEVARNKLFL